MNVRCERCQTEYELDPARLSPGGSSVKCTSCGHVFKAMIPDATDPGILVEDPTGVTVEAQLWMLRQPDGTISRVPDLMTLQQLIVEGRVSRDYAISRTGEVWRTLGEVAELSSFFLPATSRRSPTLVGRPGAVPDPDADAPTIDRSAVPRPMTVQQTRPQLVFAPGVLSGPPASQAPAPPSPPAPAAVAPPSPPAVTPSARRPAVPPGPPSGPRAAAIGLAGGASEEPAWAGKGGGAPRLAGGAGETGPMRNQGRVLAAPDVDDDYPEGRRKRSKAPWILLAVGAVGAAGGAYVLTRDDGKGAVAITADAAPAVAVDAPKAVAVAPVKPDAAPIVQPIGPAAAALAKARDMIDDDTDASLTEAEKVLTAARGPDPAANARVLAALSRVHAIVAQHLLDDAADPTADKRVAEQRKAESTRRRQRAEAAAKEALAASPNGPDASIALADAKRLAGGKTSEIEKLLAVAGEDPEAAYVRAMVMLRDKKDDAAKAALTKVAQASKAAGGEHVRARERLARLALAKGKLDEAQAELDLALAAAPGNPRLIAVGAQIAAKKAGATAAGTPTGEAGSGSGPEPTTYDGLVAKGDRLAESNKCQDALDAYEKAYDLEPGAEALTGQGYCYLDMSLTAAALAKFRAALAIDSRSGDAIIGMAEVNRAKGDKAEAAKYYARYLEVYPGGPKAALARKWSAELGAQATPGGDPAGTGTAGTTEPPPVRPDAAAATPPPATPPPDRLPDKPTTTDPPTTPAPELTP